MAALVLRRRALERCLRDAFPRLADFCLFHLATPRTLRCVAGAHRAPNFTRDMRMFVAGHSIRRDDLVSTVATVVRSSRPALRTAIHPDSDSTAGGTIAQLHRKLAPTSALVVPVMRDGAVVGALSLCYSHSRRSHAAHHVPLAERLAMRIAAALTVASDAALRIHAAARHAGQRGTVRRRLAARD